MNTRRKLTAALLAALLSMGVVACEDDAGGTGGVGDIGGEGDVGEPDTGIAEEEMGDPGEAGGDVPADTGEDDL